VIHYHIFKNAGTSVDHALQASFGSGWGAFEGKDARDVQPAERVRAHLEAHPELNALSTHLGRPPLPWPECLPIVFLRHPIVRVRSVYDHHRRESDFASRFPSVRDWVEWALDAGRREGGVVIRNYQVVHLSDASFREGNVVLAEATSKDLARASSLLQSFGRVGIVERFAASLAMFQAAYAPALPELRLEPRWSNRAWLGPPDPGEQMEALERAVGPALFGRLVAENRLDLELYDEALSRFDRGDPSVGGQGQV
jgi:hypothetical protein